MPMGAPLKGDAKAVQSVMICSTMSGDHGGVDF